MAKVDVHEGKTVVDTLVLVKIDPSRNRIRIIHDKNIKTIEEWQKVTGASVIFNGSYFRENFEPCALVLSDGQSKGPKYNRYMKGMFVAEPKRADLPRAAILDLTRMTYIPKNSAWEQGLQSFPVLLDPQGHIRVDSSDLKASRTAICTTRDDCILVVHTEEAYFTLHALAAFLKKLQLNIETALNLDGGIAAELCVKTGNLAYSHYGYQISNYTSGNFGLKGIQSRIPMVVGVFPR
ncbi:MAG: phosphodiester glycosidase family protein [Pseudomonadota bacterium]